MSTLMGPEKAATFPPAYADLATEEGFYPEGPASTTGPRVPLSCQFGQDCTEVDSS